jgi:hypothetical protein
MGTMVSIMSILTKNITREVFPEIVVVFLPLVFCVIVPLGVLVDLILVSPSGMILLRVIFFSLGLLLFLFFPLLLELFD